MRMTNEQKEYIVTHKDDIPLSQIAQKLNLTHAGVLSYLKRNNLSYNREINAKNRSNKTSRETERKVIQMANSGYLTKDIVKATGISKGAIYRILKDNDIKSPCSDNPWNATDSSQIQEIISLNGKMPAVEIARRFNITSQTVYNILKNNNVQPIKFQKRSFDTKYFDIIDDEHKAYWLGFIMADGSISHPSKETTGASRLTLNLSIKDIELLQRFKKDIQANNNIIEEYIPNRTYSQNKMCRLSFNSIEFCRSLKRYGIDRCKTGKETIPTDKIPQCLMKHFIRGFFDGDGCVTYNKRNDTVSPIIFFTSANIEFLEDLKMFLIDEIGTSRMVSVIPSGKQGGRVKHSYQISYGKRDDVVSFYNYIYEDATIFLERKKNKFDSLLLS